MPYRAASNVHRKLAWLVWLALLLPMAQAAAKWHGYSHPRVSTSQYDTSQAPQLDHCDRCLAAAALSGGALPSVVQQPLNATQRHEKPIWSALGVRAAHIFPGYRSRAPPAIPR